MSTLSPILLTFFIVMLVIALIAGVISGYPVKKYLNEKVEANALFKNPFLIILASAGGFILFFTLAFLMIALGKNHVLGNILTVLGAFVFSTGLASFLLIFVIHYYKWNVVKYKQKLSKILLMISLPVAVIGLFLLLDGLTYIEIITYLNNKISIGPVNIAFYAIFILSGAIITYFIADHEFFKKYNRHGILESTFYIAFPAGIIGARLWYALGEWNKPQLNGKTFGEDLLNVFKIWEGGLAIMGGVLFGALAGIIFMRLKRKEYSLRFAVDAVVPAILVAQAVGRWGNFFNVEVYGGTISDNSILWNFIPHFVKEQMLVGGDYKLPLAFIEFITNLLGYFTIKFAIGKGLEKFRLPLDMGFAYVIWYSLTRILLEPLRDKTFQMGSEGFQWSYVWAWIFLALGVVGIIANHVVSALIKKNKVAEVSNEQ